MVSLAKPPTKKLVFINYLFMLQTNTAISRAQPQSPASKLTSRFFFFFSSRAQPQKQPLSQRHAMSCQLTTLLPNYRGTVTELSDPLL